MTDTAAIDLGQDLDQTDLDQTDLGLTADTLLAVRRYPTNRLNYSPIVRALIVAMADWTTKGTAPPASRWRSRRERSPTRLGLPSRWRRSVGHPAGSLSRASSPTDIRPPGRSPSRGSRHRAAPVRRDRPHRPDRQHRPSGADAQDRAGRADRQDRSAGPDAQNRASRTRRFGISKAGASAGRLTPESVPRRK